MWFDVQAALAEIEARAQGAEAQPDARPEAPRVARAARAPGFDSRNAPAEPVARPSADRNPRHGCMVRLAWSGEWVSADRYATMTDRERHGPQGKLWCGKCAHERDRNAALRCLGGEACQ